jgi:hypothetical protein
MKKDLIIIPASVSEDKILEYSNKSRDVLALTPSAMLSLDVLNIPYKTTEDFYNTEIYRNDIRTLNEQTEKLFSELDKASEIFVNFPYAYTGNISYFLQLLGDLLYIEHISRKMEESYRRIYLVGNATPTKLSWGSLKYSDLKSNSIASGLSIPQVIGLENKIKILKNILHIELIPGAFEGSPNIPCNFKARAFFVRAMRYLETCKTERKIPILERWSARNDRQSADPGKASLFVIQGGYEPVDLRKYMPDFNFRNPIFLLRKKAPSVAPIKYDFSEVMLKLNKFLQTNYPKLNSLIASLFSSYHREIVGRLSYYKQSFEDLVDHHRPKVLLFSVGTRDVFDSVFAYIANQRNIPVIYFQHGGPSTFFKNFYQKYVETDVKIEKTLILNSTREIEQAKHDGSKCIALGSILRYQLIKNSQGSVNEKILYCCGPPVFHTYRHALCNVMDKECYQINRDIIDVAQENCLSIDIKLHPTEQDYCFHYFRQLIDTVKHTGARIIYGIPAESIMKSYGLIILDFLGTAIAPYALSLKVPIILYLKDMNLVNPLGLEDLKRRCYIVQNREMLRKVLGKYSRGKLPSKWSKEIIDRYVYPVESGDPGRNIANYIRSIC